MCGISGIIAFKHNNPVPSVQKMVDAMYHRGPDDQGINLVCENPEVAFGHNRLSIIDLSPAGHQPMLDGKTGNWIVFNGEIYNFRELRETLKGKGYDFNSHCDTEVILKAYAEWGEDCCQKLRGIFAFGLWDHQRQQLLLARDPLGVKPLYIFQNQNMFIFASEVRAILASGNVPRKVDPLGLRTYLAYGSVQEPYSLVKGIASLPPASLMTVRDGKCESRRYWQPCLTQNRAIKAEDAQSMVASMLSDSVKSQLVSDAPIGAFLSGGIDSSAIVSIMSQENLSGKARTFSIVFDDVNLNEQRFAQMVADKMGTEHVNLKLTGKMVVDNLPRALQSFDQPSMDGLNTWFVSKVTKEAGLTVALSGVGGDELFAGYNRFKKQLLAERCHPFVKTIPSFIGNWLERFAGSEKTRKLAEMIKSPNAPYFLTRKVFTERQISDLMNEEMKKQTDDWFPPQYNELINDTSDSDFISRISWLEINTYMRSTLLRDTDQMSMSHALEIRVPLIDQRLVELLLTIPGNLKLDSRTPKPLLVAGVNGNIPDACIYRAKQGFVLPFDRWLKEELNEPAQNFFNHSECCFLKSEGLKSLWASYLSGNVCWSRLWSLYVLQHWFNENNITCD